MQKEQRIEQTFSKMIPAVKIGEDEVFTVDSCETDYNAEDDVWVWTGEDALQWGPIFFGGFVFFYV